MKTYKTERWKSRNNDFVIDIQRYTTKTGVPKFHIDVYAEQRYNENGFCAKIASYNTADNALSKFLRMSNLFMLVEVVE